MTDTDIEVGADWCLEWRGKEWRPSDLTGRHAAVVAELLGVDVSWSWFDVSDVNPWKGPLHTVTLIAAFTCVDEQVIGAAAQRAVLETIKDATLDELADALKVT